jgi:hypothetical protein
VLTEDFGAPELQGIENRENGRHKGKAYSADIFVGMMEETWRGAKSYEELSTDHWALELCQIPEWANSVNSAPDTALCQPDSLHTA